MRTVLMLALATCALGLAACKDNKSADNTPPQPEPSRNEIMGSATEEAPISAPRETAALYYKCDGIDDLIIFTASDNDMADMRRANVSYAMEQVISASGAKYQNLGDDSTIFWNKGTIAYITINGEDLGECNQTAKPEAPPKPYHASGNEPGWIMTIDNGTITLNADYGDSLASLPVHSDETAADDTRLVTARDEDNTIIATISETACFDTMSGEAFAHQVTVIYNDKTYQGCGQSLIRDIEWVLEDINNAGIIDRSQLTLTLDHTGRIFGHAGCNRYSGSYSLEGENLHIGQNIVSTMMACMAESMMAQERTFLNLLPEMDVIAFDDTGALILKSSDDSASMRFRQQD